MTTHRHCFCCFHIITLVLLMSATAHSSASLTTVDVLVLLPSDGYADDCQVAMLVAFDVANNWQGSGRGYVAPDIRLRPLFVDASAESSMRALVEFANSCRRSRSRQCSPIVIGPWQRRDCDAIASSVHLFNATALTGGCRHPEFSENRRRYPRLFRSQLPVERQSLAILGFVARVGNWSRIAVVSPPSTDDDYEATRHMLIDAPSQRVTVGLTLQVSSPLRRQALEPLANSPYRIVVLLAAEDARMATSLLCRLWQLDVSSRRGFLFILPASAFVNPLAEAVRLPEGCTRQMLTQQYSSSIWVGDVLLGAWYLSSTNKTVLGYNISEFASEFFARKPQEVRYAGAVACHDTALMAIEALKKLRQQPPSTVTAVLSQLEFVPLANSGRPLRLSPRLEMDDMAQVAFQFNASTGSLDAVVELIFDDDDDQSGFVPSTWLRRQVTWPGGSNKAPRDFVDTRVTDDDIPLAASIVFGFLSVALLLFNLLLLVVWLALLNVAESYLPLSRLLIIVGMILLDIASLLFIVDNATQLDIMCRMRLLLGALGTGIVLGALVAKFVCFYVRIRQSPIVSSTASNDAFVVIGSGASLGLFVVLFLLWSVFDPIRGKFAPGYSRTIWDRTPSLEAEVCLSAAQPLWLSLFGVVIVIEIVVSLLLALVTRRVRDVGVETGLGDMTWWRVVALLVAASAVAFPGQLLGQVWRPTSQRIVASGAFAVLSLVFDACLFVPPLPRTVRLVVSRVFATKRQQRQEQQQQ